MSSRVRTIRVEQSDAVARSQIGRRRWARGNRDRMRSGCHAEFVEDSALDGRDNRFDPQADLDVTRPPPSCFTRYGLLRICRVTEQLRNAPGAGTGARQDFLENCPALVASDKRVCPVFEEDSYRFFGRPPGGCGGEQRSSTLVNSPVHVGAACDQEPQGPGPLRPINLVAGAARER